MHIQPLQRWASIVTIVTLICPSFAQAATLGYFPSDSGLTVANIDTGARVQSISVTSSNAVTASGTGVYVSNSAANTVSVIDARTNAVVTVIAVGSSPLRSVVSGTGVYVANQGGNSVSIIDRRTNTVVKTISVGSFPSTLAASGTGVYITNQSGNSVSIIDTRTNTVVKTVSVGTNPQGAAASGTGMYIANRTSNDVSIIDVRTNTVAKTLSAGTNPCGAATSGTGVYIVNCSSHTVSIIDIRTNTIVKTVTVGTNPTYIITNGTGAYITHITADTEVMDTGRNILLASTVQSGGSYAPAIASDTVTMPASLTIPSSAAGCPPMLHVQYSFPETIKAESVIIQLYNNDTHAGTLLTMNSDATADFVMDLHHITGSTNVLLSTADSVSDGNYTVYLTYQDQFSNSAGSTNQPVTVSTSGCPVSSVSASSAPDNTPSHGGHRGSTVIPLSFTSSSHSNVAVASSASSVRPSVIANGQSYNDVSTADWFGTFVQKVLELKIFEGYKKIDGTPLGIFGPGDSITFGQLAKVGTILRNKKDITPKPSGDQWYQPYINSVKAMHLSVFGSSLDPLGKPTRGQVIQTILEALQIPITGGIVTYADVPSSSPYAKAIATATTLGFISGDSGTKNFRPNDPINRAEVAKMLSLALAHVDIHYLDDFLHAAASSSVAPVAVASSVGGDIRTVQSSILHVRADARIDATLLWTAQKGDQMQVLAIVQKDWAHIRTLNGKEGYVSAQYLGQ